MFKAIYRRLKRSKHRPHASPAPEPPTATSVEGHILLEPYDAVYIEVPKVACSSLKAAFAPLIGVDLQEADGDPHRVRFPAPRVAQMDSDRLYPGLFAFAFVRNPWDRLVSCYRDKIRGEVNGFTHSTVRPGVANCLARFDGFVPGMSFEAFARVAATIPDDQADAHFRSQHTFMANRAGDLAVDFVGRYENLLDDFKAVGQRIGLPDIELPRLQAATKAVQYPTFYTPVIRDLVAERYRKDIEAFGYQFDPT